MTRSQTTTLQMRTTHDENEAHRIARSRNGERNLDWVVVEGPEDQEWTVMRINDAIEGDFRYSWRA